MGNGRESVRKAAFTPASQPSPIIDDMMSRAHVGTVAPTSIHVERQCTCPFSIAQEYAVAYLKAAEAGGPEARIGISWPKPLPVLRRRVWFSFGLALDVAEAGRLHDEIRLRWNGGSALFPNFRGTVRFRIAGAGTIVLFDGTYEPPLRIAGLCFDRVIGRWIAKRTLQDLARRICDESERRERDWRASLAAVDA